MMRHSHKSSLVHLQAPAYETHLQKLSVSLGWLSGLVSRNTKDSMKDLTLLFRPDQYKALNETSGRIGQHLNKGNAAVLRERLLDLGQKFGVRYGMIRYLNCYPQQKQ